MQISAGIDDLWMSGDGGGGGGSAPAGPSWLEERGRMAIRGEEERERGGGIKPVMPAGMSNSRPLQPGGREGRGRNEERGTRSILQYPPVIAAGVNKGLIEPKFAPELATLRVPPSKESDLRARVPARLSSARPLAKHGFHRGRSASRKIANSPVHPGDLFSADAAGVLRDACWIARSAVRPIDTSCPRFPHRRGEERQVPD